MQVTDIQLTKNNEWTELSAMMDDYRLWYRVYGNLAVSERGDTFLAAGFFPAMATGETLEIDSSVKVSPKLIKGVMQLQKIFGCWNPLLKRFNVRANETAYESINNGTAAFFSGGIDGLYTLQKHKDEITHLVYINGFDFEMIPEVFEVSVARNRQMAMSLNKILIPVETNHYAFMQHCQIDRLLNHGSCLASVALLLGFPKTYIPSSYTYNQLHPWGSHPLTDPLWSSEGMELIHDDAEANRIQKIQQLVEDDTIREHLDNLIVCWNEPNSNCCECGKCVRTILTFDVLGIKLASFPKELSLIDIIRKIKFDASHRIFFETILELAQERNERKIANAVTWAIRKNIFVNSFKELDRRHLGGVVRQLYRLIKYRGYEPEPEFVKLTPE